MTDLHFEPYVHLAGLTHDDVLVAWGGFTFRDADQNGAGWHIVEDPELENVGARRHTIGFDSEPYGRGRVQVLDDATGDLVAEASTSDTNHVWVRGLEPDTPYRYRVTVDGRPWADGPRREWVGGQDGRQDLQPVGRSYQHRFRTFPHPDTHAPLRFAVLGDYGVGILASDQANGDRQRRIAAVLERLVDQHRVRLVITTGDNVYTGEEDTAAGSGAHDDDWFFSFYQPYRYVIDRVPVYPGVGNHDSSDTEQSDDRDQLNRNFFTELRFADEVESSRSSVDPGLFYRFRYGADIEFVAIDSTLASDLEVRHFFDHPKHREFLETAFAPEPGAGPARWRVPFSHHPPYCAGPSHDNMHRMIERVVPLLERAGVRAMFSGHEHNFQHQRTAGVDYFVSGAAGKLDTDQPDRFADAHTQSWGGEAHLLLVEVDAERMTVHPVTGVDDRGQLEYLSARTPEGAAATLPIVVERSG